MAVAALREHVVDIAAAPPVPATEAVVGAAVWPVGGGDARLALGDEERAPELAVCGLARVRLHHLRELAPPSVNILLVHLPFRKRRHNVAACRYLPSR